MTKLDLITLPAYLRNAYLTFCSATGTAGVGHLEYRFRQIKNKLGLDSDEDIESVLLADAAAVSAESLQRSEQRSSEPDKTPYNKQHGAILTLQNTIPVSDAKRRAIQSEPNAMRFVLEQPETNKKDGEHYWITLRLPTYRAFLRNPLRLPGQKGLLKTESPITSTKEDERRRKLSESLKASWARRLANAPSPQEIERRRRQSEAMKAAHARRSAKKAYFQSPDVKPVINQEAFKKLVIDLSGRSNPLDGYLESPQCSTEIPRTIDSMADHRNHNNQGVSTNIHDHSTQEKYSYSNR